MLHIYDVTTLLDVDPLHNVEARLGSVLSVGFDDCATIAGKFKLIDSYQGLLDR